MSKSEQATFAELLKEAIGSSEESEPAVDELGGAHYGRDTNRASVNRDDSTNQCRNCEREIGSHVARTVGDNNGCVQGCVECVTDVHGMSYSSDVRAAVSAMKGRAKDKEAQ